SARVWAADTGVALSGLLNQGRAVDSASFVLDPTRVLSTTYSGSTMLWRETAPTRPAVRTRLPTGTVSVELSTDGNQIFVADHARAIHVLDGKSLNRIRTTRLEEQLASIAVDPTDRYLAVGTVPGKIHLLELPELRLSRTFSTSSESVRSLQFNPDGSRLLAVHWGRAQLWDTATGVAVGPAMGHIGPIRHAILSPNGESVITCGNDNAMKHWMPAMQDTPVNAGARNSDVQMTQFDPTSTRLLIIPSGTHPFVTWLGSDSNRFLTLPHGSPANFGAFDSTGARVVTASDDQTAKVWNVQSTAELIQTIPHRGRVRWAAFGPDGSTLVTATADARLQVWDIRTGESLTDVIELTATWGNGMISLKGRRFLAATRDGTMAASHLPEWMGSSQEATKLADHANRLARLRFTPPDVFQPFELETGSRITEMRDSR
ncbi:MAG: hypothetical protein FJ405_12245, partial [Verrucomicrobia bacterium]|nr:hypothetical protein [Verrucomicrobiota bacterium]